MLFTWNLSPLQSSKFSFEYLLLSPRSALRAVPSGLTPMTSSHDPHACLLREFWHLNLTFGSSRIASSAYQKWPTRNSHSIAQVHLSNLKLLTYLKFENRLRLFQPQGL
ncbi:hypothetical protein Glove_50g83 [Diversispora epigaea]|uniref:Uncharacterized protein n=1 Tax=Diversispora epigaea TaxID=1348612 RepID=A0A397JFU6_9GLOM|nr:hypothetical protein Glove_335g32 [Diversispora epigaea]RHZ86457.1 hypothetical protein Glove_50g83 [Diversispora epigaea]